MKPLIDEWIDLLTAAKYRDMDQIMWSRDGCAYLTQYTAGGIEGAAQSLAEVGAIPLRVFTANGARLKGRA